MVGSASQEKYQFIHPATGCARCPNLVSGRHTVVWGRGPEPADIMAIGEAPGANEDRIGLPFAGSSGRVMKEVLDPVGLSYFDLHIGNTIMCHPPGNRDPEPDEIENCNPWLTMHVAAVNPRAIVLFGRYAINRYFDEFAVGATQGLMYQWQCDTCGGLNNQHICYCGLPITSQEHNYLGGTHQGTPRCVVDGHWAPQNESQRCKMRRRLVVAIYHPAATFHNPESKVAIIEQLRRLVAELNDGPLALHD